MYLTAEKQNLKQKQYCNRFNTDFKNGPHFEKISCELKIDRQCSNFSPSPVSPWSVLLTQKNVSS